MYISLHSYSFTIWKKKFVDKKSKNKNFIKKKIYFIKMRIAIIGAGYVGLATGIGFAEFGNEVWFYDIDDKKMDELKRGKIPIYEKGLNEYFKKNRQRIHFAEKLHDAVRNTDIAFICVGTPTIKGRISLKYVKTAADEIGKVLKDKKTFYGIVIKSTVVPGTAEKVEKIIERRSGKKAGEDFGVASNPEFLREGNAMQDFLSPDRIVIGTEDEKMKKLLLALYKPIKSKKFFTDRKTAEFIKYVSNSFLAMKISFANEIGNLCKKEGVDVYEVMRGISLDKRISPYFLNAGIGFGGSCFPKDVKALINFGKRRGIKLKILEKVLEVNDEQPLRAVELLTEKMKIKGKNIGILGLSFKPETDDIRESRAIPILKALLKEGANIYAYDPKAMKNMEKLFPNINYCRNGSEVVEKSDAIIIATEWEEFANLNFKKKIVIDGRRIKAKNAIYEGVCW